MEVELYIEEVNFPPNFYLDGTSFSWTITFPTWTAWYKHSIGICNVGVVATHTTSLGCVVIYMIFLWSDIYLIF